MLDISLLHYSNLNKTWEIISVLEEDVDIEGKAITAKFSELSLGDPIMLIYTND